MFKLKKKHTMSELSAESLRLVNGGTGDAVVEETTAEEREVTMLLMPIGGTKVPPP